MKKILTQKINVLYAVVIALAAVFGTGYAVAEYAAPGQGIIPLIHTGGGDQSIQRLELGICPEDSSSLACGVLSGVDFNALGSDGGLSLFARSLEPSPGPGSNFTFNVIGGTYFLGKLFIGQGAGTTLLLWTRDYGGGINSFNVPLQKVNVHGNILSTELMTKQIGYTSSGGPMVQNSNGDVRVCVENDGDIVLCPEIDYFEYQCDYSDDEEWSQPTYSESEGTSIRGGIVQGGVLVYSECPVNSIPPTDAYNSSRTYTTSDRVCSASQPNGNNCIAPAVPAFVCGVATPGEWNARSYTDTICPFGNYLNGSSYDQGESVCAPDGTPDNTSCLMPAVPAYLCQANGEWNESAYQAETCPYGNYSSSTEYDNGDLVCAPNTSPDNANCTGSAIGICGSAAGATTSTPPSSNLCETGEPSSVNFNTSNGTYNWSCSGSNGGNSTPCESNYEAPLVSGQCNTFSGNYPSQPANINNGCDTGSYVDITDTPTVWRWSCGGNNGGEDDSCSALREWTSFTSSEPLTTPSCRYVVVDTFYEHSGDSELPNAEDYVRDISTGEMLSNVSLRRGNSAYSMSIDSNGQVGTNLNYCA
jgi:hypothetical protein